MQMTKLATRTPYCNRYFILYRVQRPLSADLPVVATKRSRAPERCREESHQLLYLLCGRVTLTHCCQG